MTAIEKEIFNHLRELGCCLNCSARYLCDKSYDFSDINAVIKEKGLITCDVDDECPIKKSKCNPCVVCLGLLQEATLEEIVTHSDIKTADVYDSKVFTVSISMPASILVREHSMRLYLESRFSEFFNEENYEIPLNRAWKMFVKTASAKQINKTFQNSDICDFFINITMDYEEDASELLVLKEMQPKIFETRTVQHRKFSGELFSRKGVLSALAVTSSGTFKMFTSVPPEVPTKYLTCKKIECKHNSIYIAGRYCKYSRNLSQSPWIIDGVKTMETSVQEIMFGSIQEVLGVPEENMKFSSSGREDCDVRCLGRGRPFYIEFMDPKKTQFSRGEFRQLERKINESPLINVRDLQKVNRVDLVKIKEGEELKTKKYVALCVTKVPVSEEMIERINSMQDGLVLSQKTPVRVLHRRPLAVRQKRIEEMRATSVRGQPNCFELHLVTQAGTYVKEFVHGDFGRTKPNIGEIIGAEVDIAALDVVAINLDWPEPVDYENI